MNTDQEDIELIERFINGSLNHDELVDFETRLEEDHEFARKFRLRKAFPSLFNASGNDLIIQDIKESPEQEIPMITAREETQRGFKPGYIIWPILIILAALVFIWFFFLRTAHSPIVSGEPVNTPVKNTSAVKVAVPAQTQARPSVQPTAQVGLSAEPTAKVNPASQGAESQTTAPAKTRTEPPMPVAPAGKVIELISPADNMVVTRGEDLVFKWKMATDSFTNFYIIAEASNKLAWWRGIKPGIRELTVPAINFKPGKFYWYVGRREYKRTLIVME